MSSTLERLYKQAEDQNALRRDGLAMILGTGSLGILGGAGLSALSNSMRPDANLGQLPVKTYDQMVRMKSPVKLLPQRPPTPGNELAEDRDAAEAQNMANPGKPLVAMSALKAGGLQAQPRTMFQQVADMVPDSMVSMLPEVTGGSGARSWWAIPAATGALMGGGLMAKELTDSAYKSTRDDSKEEALNKARSDYSRALTSQYRTALKPPATKLAADQKAAVELSGHLDRLYDQLVKQGEPDLNYFDPATYLSAPLSYLGNTYSNAVAGQKGWTAAVPGGGKGSTMEAVADPLVGMYGAAALASAGLGGYGAYHWTKANSPWNQANQALKDRERDKNAPATVQFS